MRVREFVVALALAVGIGAATPAAATETAVVDPALLRQLKTEYAWHWGRPHYRRVYRRYGYYRPYGVYRPYGYYRPYPVYGGYPYGYGRPGVGVYFRY